MALSEQPRGGASGGASVHFERERGVTEVSVMRGLAHVTVRLPLEDRAGERLALLLGFADAGVSLFLIKLHPDAISFAVRADAIEACEALLQKRKANYLLLRDLALVATVAGAMRDLSGVIARIYEAMVAQNIRVRQTGDAYNAVLCLVAGDEADRAAAALQKAFSLTDSGGAGLPGDGPGRKAP